MRLTDNEIEAIAQKIVAKTPSSGRRPIVVGNWKMHKTPSEGEALVRELAALVETADCEIGVAPAYPCLGQVGRALGGSKISLCAQNAYWEKAGAFTGEVAIGMLTELGVSQVIIGHSERRQFFGETDETVNLRAKAVLEAGLVPILCVGESLQERDSGLTHAVVDRQVRGGLADLSGSQVAGMVLAYEPVWAIGTGKVATVEEAQEVHSVIRQLLAELHDAPTAGAVRIQYGGSVKPDNAAQLLAQPDIDGALVGGAALKATDFAAICMAAKAE